MIELPVTLTSTGGAVSFASPVTLGYTKNKGVYRLLVTAEGEWEGLTIRCFWHLPGDTDPASSLVQDGAVDVPASVTAQPGTGCITFEGSDGEKTVTSADLRYKVGSNSGTEDGTMPEPGTPAWEQLVSETKANADAAERAKNDAQAAAEGVKTDAAKADEAASAAAKAAQKAEAAQKATEQAEAAAAKSAQAAMESKTAAATSEGNAAASAKKAQDVADSLPVDYMTAVNEIAALKINKADKADLETVQKQIGNLDDLTTKAKETLVAAINEAARTGAAMRTDGGYIQYSTDDGSTWENLIALAELKGEPGQNGADGAPGADGYSPTASVEQSTDGAKITITDKSGTTEAVVKNGKDGANGRDGADGQPGRDGVNGQPGKDGTDGITPTIGDNGNWFLGATDTGKPSRGATGDTGADGKDAPQIDDTAITTTNPWSSKHIIDMLCPPLEESGNPVVCYPVAGYPLGVKAKWEPVQEGSGTPSLENIRPIKGRDSVTITRQEDNQVITLTLPETVYGGEVDAVSGEGKQTWKIITIDAKEIKFTSSSNNIYWNLPQYTAVGVTRNSKSVCSHFISTTFMANETYAFFYTQPANLQGLFSNVDELNDYCAAQYAAGTPVQIAYQLLKVPVPFTTTGAQPLPALAGPNTVLTDADSATVTGRADPIKRITDLEDAVASQT